MAAGSTETMDEYLEREHPCAVFDPHIKFHDFYTDPDTHVVREHIYLVSSDPDPGSGSGSGPGPGHSTALFDFSATTFVHSFFPHFDADAVIAKMIKGIKWKKDQSYPYYQMPAADIKALWHKNGNNASTLGTLMHARIEKFYNHPDLWKIGDSQELKAVIHDLNFFTQPEMDSPEMMQFFRYHFDGPCAYNWKPWRTELRVFDRDIRVAGSVDMLYKSPAYTAENKQLVMIDWKRSKEIVKGNPYRKYAHPPIAGMDDNNFSKYSLQLNVYKRIIEKNTDLKIVYMALGVFHPNQDSYHIFPVEHLPVEVDRIWAKRLEQLALRRTDL
jgi:hypothetical protein